MKRSSVKRRPKTKCRGHVSRAALDGFRRAGNFPTSATVAGATVAGLPAALSRVPLEFSFSAGRRTDPSRVARLTSRLISLLARRPPLSRLRCGLWRRLAVGVCVGSLSSGFFCLFASVRWVRALSPLPARFSAPCRVPVTAATLSLCQATSEWHPLLNPACNLSAALVFNSILRATQHASIVPLRDVSLSSPTRRSPDGNTSCTAAGCYSTCIAWSPSRHSQCFLQISTDTSEFEPEVAFITAPAHDVPDH